MHTVHTLGKYKVYKITLYEILNLSSLCSLHPVNARTLYHEIVEVEPQKCHLWIKPLDLVSPEVQGGSMGVLQIIPNPGFQKMIQDGFLRVYLDDLE